MDSNGVELSNLGVGGMFSLRNTELVADLLLAGGSGYGDPLDRPYSEVQCDLDGEYVTPEGAERDYGCVIGANGQIAAAASDDLRKKRRKVRKAVE
jgi:N-methylhydantoinase B/oxoprolinase/acetone carboxylase alpha subunit